jgi:hypothetical protein
MKPVIIDNVERMGDALFALSASLRASLGDDRLHAQYEEVVAAWQALVASLSEQRSEAA